MANPIDTYKKVNISQEVSQYRAVQLLLDGAIERVKLARHAQETGNPERRGVAVSSTADATAAFLILLLRGESGAAYNVSLDQEITILELALLVARLSPTPGLKVKHPPSAPARQSLFRSCGHCDISKLEKLGWRPTIMPAEGFERTLRYFIDN